MPPPAGSFLSENNAGSEGKLDEAIFIFFIEVEERGVRNIKLAVDAFRGAVNDLLYLIYPYPGRLMRQ